METFINHLLYLKRHLNYCIMNAIRLYKFKDCYMRKTILIIGAGLLLAGFALNPFKSSDTTATVALPFSFNEKMNLTFEGTYTRLDDPSMPKNENAIHFVPSEMTAADYQYDEYIVFYKFPEQNYAIVTKRKYETMDECQYQNELLFKRINKDNSYKEKDGVLMNDLESIAHECKLNDKKNNYFVQYVVYSLNKK